MKEEIKNPILLSSKEMLDDMSRALRPMKNDYEAMYFNSIQEELYKRLSKNNIEEFKKKLIKELKEKIFMNFDSSSENTENTERDIYNLINNLK